MIACDGCNTLHAKHMSSSNMPAISKGLQCMLQLFWHACFTVKTVANSQSPYTTDSHTLELLGWACLT